MQICERRFFDLSEPSNADCRAWGMRRVLRRTSAQFYTDEKAFWIHLNSSVMQSQAARAHLGWLLTIQEGPLMHEAEPYVYSV